MCTLNDHTSTITSIHFAEDLENDKTRLVSCSADKTILFRTVEYSDEITAPVYHRELTPAPLYDIELDPTEMSLLGVGVEPKLLSWDAKDGKKSKSMPFSDLETSKCM